MHSNPDIILGSFNCPQHQSGKNCLIAFKKFNKFFLMQCLFLGGDFNCPGIDWGSGDLTELYISASFRESLIVLSQDFLLEQIVTA